MRYLLSLTGMVAGLSAAVSAQAPDATTPGALRPSSVAEIADHDTDSTASLVAVRDLRPGLVPLHTAPDDADGGAYGLWAAGRQYKVSFHDDPTFIPYLGSSYPNNQPLRWTTVSIHVGANVLMRAGDRPERFHTETRFEYRYAGVVEAYDVLEHGLEQTFVLAKRPAVVGDLVVEGRFTTQLRALEEFSNQHRGVAFADDQGRELIRYGAATVLDAAGRRLPIGTTIQDHRITLTVPAAFLETATYPVTLDPLTTPVTLETGAEILTVDVCRNDRQNNACVTFSRAASATDADCYAWNAPDDLSALGTLVFTDITSSWSTDETTTAHIGTAAVNRFVVCIGRKFSTSSGVRVWNQDASAPTLSTSVQGIATGGNHNWNVDCGGIEAYNQSGAAASGVEGIVVYQVDAGGAALVNTDTSSVRAVILTGSATGVALGQPIDVGSSASSDYDKPSVTKVSAGADGTTPADWVIGYQQYNLNINGDDWDAVCRRVFADGTFDSRTWIPSINSGAHRLDVQVEGQRGRYTVLYGRVDEQGTLTKVTGYRSNQIMRERFDYPVGGFITKQTANEASLNQSSRTLRSYDLAYDTDNDSVWCTMWGAPGGSGRIFVERCGYSGASLGAERIFPVSGTALPRSGIAFNDDQNEFLMAFGQQNGDLESARMEYPAEVPPSYSPPSCSTAQLSWVLRDANGTTISNSNQNQQIGSEFGHVRVTGGHANALHFVVVTIGPGGTTTLPQGPPFYPANAGCTQYVPASGPSYLGVLPIGIGPTAEWKLSLPEWLGNFELHFQDVHTDVSGTLLNSTTRLTVPFVK